MMFLLTVTIVSMIVAVIMSVVAWRVAGEERRRSDARVASLAADIHDGDLEIRPSFAAAAAEAPGRAEAGMFSVVQPEPSGSRFAAVLTLGVVVVVTALTGVVLLSSRFNASDAPRPPVNVERPSPPPSLGPALARASAGTAANGDVSLPLELVALGHDRAAGMLTVRGVIRNPSAGGDVDRLTAVVFVFNRDGGFVGSGRAVVESSLLRPGGESTFVVTIPDHGDVGRYRVSFRAEDRVVPHVDRREQTLAKG